MSTSYKRIFANNGTWGDSYTIHMDAHTKISEEGKKETKMEKKELEAKKKLLEMELKDIETELSEYDQTLYLRDTDSPFSDWNIYERNTLYNLNEDAYKWFIVPDHAHSTVADYNQGHERKLSCKKA